MTISIRRGVILTWFMVISGWTGVIVSNAQATNEILLYDFNDPAAYPGWTTYSIHKLQPSFADGALIGTVTDSNESGGFFFVTPPIQPFAASQYPRIEARMKSNKNYQFDLYWLDDVDQNWVGHDQMIPLVTDGNYHVYQADLSKNGNWHNNITQLRLCISTWQTSPPVTPQVGDNISWDYLKFKMPTIANNTLNFLNLWEREQVVGRLYHSAIGLSSTYRMRLLTSGGSELRSVTGPVTTVGMAEALLSTAGISPGNYTLEFKAFAADNITQQATATKTFPKLTTPVWLKTPAQRQVNEVPAPWTPMTTSTGQIQCWGRNYSFQSLPFPSQINSQGVNMLASPIVLNGTIDNQSIGWNAGTFTFTDLQDYKVSYQTSCTGNVADLSGSGYVEFDGMMWFDFQLNLHSANAQIGSLYLDIPLNKANALYYWYGGTSWGTYSADLFTSKSFPFMPYITVSDDDRGLCWFTESKENWSIDSSSAAQLIAGTSTNTVRIYLVNIPFTSDNQTVKFSFGLQATPVKPYPARQEDHPGRYCVTSSDGIYTFDKDIISAYRTQTIAYSLTGDQIMDLVPADSGQMLTLQNAITDCENHGIKNLSYTSLEDVNINDNALLQYGDEWMVMWNGTWQVRPVQPIDNSFPDYYYVSTASGAWQDYLVWKVQQAIDQVGLQGLYLDCSDPGSCWNPYLGGGYTDRNGIARPTLTIRANRELMKRLYHLKETHPNFKIEFHMSTFPAMSSHSFADIAMDGEQFVGKDSSSFQLPLSSFRAEFMGKVWGIPSNLWVFTRNTNAPGYFDNERAIAFGLLHGTEVNLEPSLLFLDRLGRLNDVLGFFNVSDNATIAYPYWKNPPVTVNSTDVAANVYKKPGEALILLSNLRENALTVQVQPDLGQLGLSGDIYARNYLDNETYHITSGTFSTPLDTDIRVKIFHLGTIDKLVYPVTPEPTVTEFLGDNASVSNFPPEWQACSALKNFVTTEQPYVPAAFSNLWFDVASQSPSQRIFLGIEIRETGNGNPEGDGSASILRLTLNSQNLVYNETVGHGNLVGKTQPFTMDNGVGPNTWFTASNQAWAVFYYPSFTLPTQRRYQIFRPIGANPLTYVFDITDLAIIGRNYLTLTTANPAYDSGLVIKTLAVGLTPPVTVSGTVVPNDYPGDKTAMNVRFEFRPVPTGSPTVLNTFLHADGTFTLDLDNVTLGTYNIAVKADHCLQKVLSMVNINANPSPLGTISVVNGDCDDDNEITSTDLSIVLSAMDTLPGNPAWNPAADLDGNGGVTSADLSIVLTGMDQMGDL